MSYDKPESWCPVGACVAQRDTDHECPVAIRDGVPVPRPRPRPQTRAERVREFHRHVGQPVRIVPTIPSDDEVRFRLRLITEEFLETLAACFPAEFNEHLWLLTTRRSLDMLVNWGKLSINLPELIDGLEDLDYVIEGARAVFGIDGEPFAAEVHRKNMEKIPDPNGGSKAVKPPGWTPPDIRGLLIAQGWTPPEGT